MRWGLGLGYILAQVSTSLSINKTVLEIYIKYRNMDNRGKGFGIRALGLNSGFATS